MVYYSVLSPLTLYHEAKAMGIQSTVSSGQTLDYNRFLSKGYNFLGTTWHKHQFRIQGPVVQTTIKLTSD